MSLKILGDSLLLLLSFPVCLDLYHDSEVSMSNRLSVRDNIHNTRNQRTHRSSEQDSNKSIS